MPRESSRVRFLLQEKGMHAWSKFGLIFALILASSACVPSRPVNPPPVKVPQSGTPSIPITTTGIPLQATPALAPPIASLYMMDADNGWAWTSSNRLLRTRDGSQTWTDRTPDGQVWSEGFFPLDAQTAWLPIFLKESNRFGLLHTTDGGKTWTEYPYGPASGLHFSDASNGWAVTGDVGAGNIYYSLTKTQDGGKTWAPIPVKPPMAEAGLPAGTIHLCDICEDSFYYDPNRIIIVYGDEASWKSAGAVRLQTSFNLGNTWQTRNLPLPDNASDAVVAGASATFFEGGNGLLAVHLLKMDNNGNPVYQRLAVYATQDGGVSWALVPGILENITPYAQVQIVSPKDIYVLCSNALCASHDGAQTWSKVASNLDFTQNDNRSVGLLDFLDVNTAWVSIMENESITLYKTTDGAATWTQLNPLLAASAPATTTIDSNIPTPTMIPTQTPEQTPTPDVAFDPNVHAYRIRFPPYATWVEVSGSLSANGSKRYFLSAMQGQVMSVSIPQGSAFSVNAAGADGKVLSDTHSPHPFWRGALPSTQDYIVTVESQAGGSFTLRIAINPPGQATQNFEFVDVPYTVALSYTDEFAPVHVEFPITTRGTPLITLSFIDSSFFYPTTTLSEAALMLTATKDPASVATCTQASTQSGETITGQENVNGYDFTRSELTGAATGNIYDQIFYRTVWQNKCFDVIFLIHSSPIGIFPAGTVVAYDRAALLSKFEAVLNSFLAK
jgi:photosystem II stability/assembly factor-like uncharacterized protein